MTIRLERSEMQSWQVKGWSYEINKVSNVYSNENIEFS